MSLIGVLSLLLAAGSAGAGAGATESGASARAYAVKIVVPGQGEVVAGSVAAPPNAVSFGADFKHPAETGALVSTGSIAASASADALEARASASASSEIQAVSLFGGEITAEGVLARARAEAAPGNGTGDVSEASLTKLVVLGREITEVQAGARVPLGEWGYAIVLAQGAAPGENGFRGFVTALEVHLNVDHGGLPAGSAVYVGYAEVSAAAPPPEPEPSSTPTTTATTRAKTATTPDGARRKAKPERKKAPVLRRPIPDLNVKLTPGGYVFPVHGPVSFADTFGANRAVVGWHHGEDIFAPIGAPVLAVGDGTVFSVGWNDLGGNRLWLRDTRGNEFYYAHLSAFSPLAVDGMRVKAGDVLGFVGNSGDAETTPPHLHFEIHHVSLLGFGYDGVISPYQYLTAWKRLEDIRFVAGAAWLPPLSESGAPQPGAYLLSAKDISSASGLEAGSLERALRAPASSEGS
jgi:murein DD-endopeptidase MepM/ murein hydrolase activator NlpD